MGLGGWLALIIAAVVLLMVGGGVVMTEMLGQDSIERSVTQDLNGSYSLQNVLRQLRHRQLELISRIFSTDQLLTRYLSEAAQERDVDKIFGLAREYQDLLLFNLGVVLDPDGVVLSRTDDPSVSGENLSAQTQIAVARDLGRAFGVWRQGGKLFHAVTVPLGRDFERTGYLLVAFAIDDALALQFKRISGAETVFLANAGTGPTVAASTMGVGPSEELVSALRLRGELLNRLLTRGERVADEHLELGGRPWLVRLSPLNDAAGQPVGAIVALSSLAEKLAPYEQLRWLMIGLGAAALVLGLGLALALGRRYSRPARQLTAAVEAARRGNYEVAIARSGGEFGELARGLRNLLEHLRGKQALEFFASGMARFLPEPARGDVMARPQAQKVALCAIEMRRFANPRTGYDAEESLGRMTRDLRRITTAVEAHKGQVEAVLGHRVLALFGGDGSSHRALITAVEILRELSGRENVFDEPDPPAMALTQGNVVTGTVMWGGKSQGGVAGLPVQQLESLLREATPGEIFMSKQICQELIEPLRAAGVQLRSQRGLVSPQPLYALNAENAEKIGGASQTVGAATQVGFPDEGRQLSEVMPGMVLGERFEILAELGVGPHGVVYKAQDRQQHDLVTLKLLNPAALADASRFERLKRAVQKLRALDHPNLLAVLDFGEAEGLPYLVMEFVRAMSLRHVIDHSRRMPLAAGLRLAQQLAAGLATAHDEQIVHGGIKPENVLVESRGNVRLTDFALTSPVRSGLVGTFPGIEYMAPEQLTGGEGDQRSDLYAYGAVLYELFTNRVPFSGESPNEIQLKQLEEDLALPSTFNQDISPAVEQILLRCLAKGSEQRWSSAAEVLDALDAASRG